MADHPRLDVDQRTSPDEELPDVGRIVGEHVPVVRVSLSLRRSHTILEVRTVGVKEPTDESFRLSLDHPALPLLENNRSMVLSSWSVLRDEIRPEKRVARHIDASVFPFPNCHLVERHERRNRCPALFDDPRISSIECDPKPIRPPHPRDAAVAEVHPQEVGVLPSRCPVPFVGEAAEAACVREAHMPEVGLEPTRPKGQWILNPSRITNFATPALGHRSRGSSDDLCQMCAE